MFLGLLLLFFFPSLIEVEQDERDFNVDIVKQEHYFHTFLLRTLPFLIQNVV